VRAHQVGDVEALDTQRQRVEPERRLQAVERLDALLARALVLELLRVQREPRVADREVVDAALVTSLGTPDLDLRATPLAEQLAEDGVHVVADDDLAGDARRLAVVLQQELLEHLGLALLALVGQVEGLAVRQHAVADLEHLGVGVRAARRHPDGVDRADRLVGHALALEQRADRLQAVALDRGLLELVDLAASCIRVSRLALDLAVAALEERDDAVDRLPVLRLGVVADAGRPAALM
jgi:hypothetical protein